MSPEQLSGKKIDGRSDLFSLGVTLYQMLCGQLPFTGDSMAQLMFKIANEAQPDVRLINPQVPDNLAAVIERALSKDMELRYQSGDEMARDLRSCLGQAPTAGPDVDIQL
jgi:serine/threonine protein kinase